MALVELVGVAMYARNPMELHCNFHSHMATHNKVCCLNLASYVAITMEPTYGGKLLHEPKA